MNFGWGLAVYAGVIVSYNSGAHLNPAVTLGLIASGATAFGLGVPVNMTSTLAYIGAQLAGAIVGASLAWIAYKQHFDDEPDAGNKLGVFATGPAIRNPALNVITEAIATFVLVFVVIGFGASPGRWRTRGAGRPASRTARDWHRCVTRRTDRLCDQPGARSRAAYRTRLPANQGKGSSDWGYAWVPVVGPIIGGVLAGWASNLLMPILK